MSLSMPFNKALLTNCRGATKSVLLQESLGLGTARESSRFDNVDVATQIGEAERIVVGM